MSRFVEIEYLWMYEDYEICDLSKSIVGFCLCNECGECLDE